MGILHYTVSNRTFKTVAAPASVEPGFYSDPVEIHVKRNHGKESRSYDRLDSWNVAYDRAADLQRGRKVLFVDYTRKTDLAKYYRSDVEDRSGLFLKHGKAADYVPVFETEGGAEAWMEILDRKPVGYLVPWNGKTNSDGDVLADPDGRGQWIFVRFAAA